MSCNPPLVFGPYGSSASVYVFTGESVTWRATLEGGADWLAITAGLSETGSGLVQLAARQSVSDTRSARLTVKDDQGKILLECDAVQATATPLATLNASVLEVPFPLTPRVMELGIAGKFIATEVKKIPEPFDLIALLIVEIVVLLVGLVLALLRSALASVVPEPKTWFGVPTDSGYAEPFGPFTKVLPATAVCIAEETLLLALYILKQVLGG